MRGFQTIKAAKAFLAEKHGDAFDFERIEEGGIVKVLAKSRGGGIKGATIAFNPKAAPSERAVLAFEGEEVPVPKSRNEVPATGLAELLEGGAMPEPEPVLPRGSRRLANGEVILPAYVENCECEECRSAAAVTE